ncbi:hypothetical protein, partial [Roseisolibacter sp. H3M3-2]|uniref:hypothetical protein n=1 Tax=Roseisolibacter sp. H3M3-2 TaxID=3031323 RepID=UPI0023DCEAFE
GASDFTGAPAVAATEPVGQLRARWRAPSGAALDVQGARTVLDATPLLLRNRVVRAEGAAQRERLVALGVRARASARVGTPSSGGDRNRRTALGAALARAAGPLGDLSAGVQTIAFDHPTTRGYFAAERVLLADVGTYLERESARGVTVVLDAGVGAQRVRRFGEGTSPWEGTGRLWGQLALPVGVGRALLVEVDAYDGGAGRVGPGAGRWRWFSAAVGARWAI